MDDAFAGDRGCDVFEFDAAEACFGVSIVQIEDDFFDANDVARCSGHDEDAEFIDVGDVAAGCARCGAPPGLAEDGLDGFLQSGRPHAECFDDFAGCPITAACDRRFGCGLHGVDAAGVLGD